MLWKSLVRPKLLEHASMHLDAKEPLMNKTKTDAQCRMANCLSLLAIMMTNNIKALLKG